MRKPKNKELREKLLLLENEGGRKAEKMREKAYYGFTLNLRATGGKEKYWYAGRKINGRMVWVYIGKDKSQAKERLETWFKKHPKVEALVHEK
jgi:hypothetical protein